MRCQRPKRATSISTVELNESELNEEKGVNALNGLLPFLQYPLRTRINTGFAGSVLQVIV